MFGIPDDCPLLPKLPYADIQGVCDRCGRILTGRHRRWCSNQCANIFHHEINVNHHWNAARKAALRRDHYSCVLCGSLGPLEVNHIAPLVGRGYGRGCVHHQDNLETLCKPCHLSVTAKQKSDRALAEYQRQQSLWEKSGRPLLTMERIYELVEKATREEGTTEGDDGLSG